MEAKDYRFYYPEQTEPAVSLREWQVEKGTINLLVGPSGCGKTTLLRQCMKQSGWQGREEGSLVNHAEETSYVWQNPDGQIVTDRVEYEIVFPLENIGLPKEQMRRCLAEIVTEFDLEGMMGRDTMELSGGEKQLLNIASAMAVNPRLLLLDEPASQLDPVESRRLYDMLRHICEEYGTTIIIAEQRLEEIVSLADRMVLMKEGTVAAQGSPRDIYPGIKGTEQEIFFPSYMKLFEHNVVLTKREARLALEREYETIESAPVASEKPLPEQYIECRNLSIRFEKKGRDVLSKCTCRIPKGMITALVGGNGSGKTTFLRILAGHLLPYGGKIKGAPETVSYLPQDPSWLFLEDTVAEELRDAGEENKELWQLDPYAERHPSDLSGGECQRLGLCKVLSREAECYLLDEPTKGLDRHWKAILAKKIDELKCQGKTVIVVSHDMEFVARSADMTALMFDGGVVTVERTRDFFEGNQFYTTAVHRIAGQLSSHIILEEDVKIYAKKK